MINIDLNFLNKELELAPIRTLFVQGENVADIIKINMPKMYNDIDLGSKVFVIKMLNRAGEYYEAVLPKNVSGESIVLEWTVTKEFTSVHGILKINVIALDDNGSVFSSKEGILEIQPAVMSSGIPITPETIFENYLSEMRMLAEASLESSETSQVILADMNSKIVNDVVTGGEKKVLSAEQGKILSGRINNIITGTGTSPAEVIDARYSSISGITYSTLANRLANTESKISTANYSAPVESTQPIISLPSTAVKGKLDGSLKGNTMYQVIVGGENQANLTTKSFIAKASTRYFVLPTKTIITGTGVSVDITNNTGVVANIMAIDMGTGSTNPLYNLTADQINAMIDGYWEGLGGTQPARVKSVGKNLVEGEDSQSDYLFNKIEAGTTFKDNKWIDKKLNVYNGSSSVNGKGFFINLEIGKVYTLSGKCTNFSTDTNAPRISITKRESTSILYSIPGYITGGAFSYTFTAVANSHNIRFLINGVNNTIVPVRFWDIQLEPGAVATTYEPYKETELFCPVVLNSLPNGIKDVFYTDGKLAQRTKEYVLTEVAVTGITTTYALDYVQVSLPQDAGVQNINSGGYATIQGFNGQVLAASDHYNNLANVYKWAGFSNINLILLVPKGTYLTLAQAKTALAGTKIIYQLATPIETQYPVSALQSNPSGSVIVESSVKALKSYTTKITLDTAIKSLESVTLVTGDKRTPIATSLVTIATDGLSATILNATANQIYELVYTVKGKALGTLDYKYPNNMAAQVQNNTTGVMLTGKMLNDFMAYQNAVDLQFDFRLITGGH